MGKLSNIKALIVQVNDGKDLGDILQIGRAEAMKIFRHPNKIKVLGHYPSPFGHILVVQNGTGCSSEQKIKSEQETG